jgi:hypothetical protein
VNVLWIVFACWAVVTAGALLGLLAVRYSQAEQGSLQATRLRRMIATVGLGAIAAAWYIVRPSLVGSLFILLLVAFYLVIWRGGWRYSLGGRTNRWQRLWRVLMVLWLVVLVTWTVFSGNESFPRTAHYASIRVEESLHAVGRHLEATTPGYAHAGNLELRRTRYGGLTDEQLLERLHAEFAGQVDFSDIESRYRREVSTMRPRQAKALAVTLIAWLLQCAFLLSLESMAMELGRRRDQRWAR